MKKHYKSFYDDECMFPPVCSRCREFCSYLELMATISSVKAKMIDGKFVCAECLTDKEK